MTYPYKGKYPLTQGFGEHPEWYAKFNLKGHNGIDLGLPCETKLLSPISGEITEVASDPTGYGLYIKVENSAEGCLLAHLSKQDVKVGDKVDQGQHLGWSGTTGNSTGCHLHFGYFKKPRDRKNGYNGYINPLPFLTESATLPPNSEPMNDQTKYDFGGDIGTQELGAVRSMILDLRRDLKACQEKPSNPSNPSDLSSYSVQDLLVAAIQKIFKK